MMNETQHGEMPESRLGEIISFYDGLRQQVNAITFHNLKMPFLLEFQKAHPDYGDYKLYHMLIGSSNYKGDSEMELDTADGTLENFIRHTLPNLIEQENNPAE
jgi:hypothetical protein